MSTIATQLNLGTSYLINDFYKRFLARNADQRHYVQASRVTTVIMMAVSLYITTIFQTITGAWQFIVECGAGVGLIYILRWFWWRVNAWSEISGLIAPFLAYGYVKFYTTIAFPQTLYYIVLFTTVVWLTVTFLTAPEPLDQLKEFYRRVHPGGAGWKRVAAECPEVKGDTGFGPMFVCWIASTILIYSVLFGLGKLILKDFVISSGFFVLAALMVWIIHRILSRVGWEKVI